MKYFLLILFFTLNAFANLSPINGSGTVTVVNTAGPLSVATSTTTPLISLPKSSSSADGYLSSGDWTAFNNKGGSVTASAPLVISSGDISIAKATSSVDGYLASGDFTSFNGKANSTLSNLGSTAINADLLPSSSNSKSIGSDSFYWSGITSYNLKLFNNFEIDSIGLLGPKILSQISSNLPVAFGFAMQSEGGKALAVAPQSGMNLYLATADNGSQSGDIIINTGNAPTQGAISLKGNYIDVNSLNIKNVATPIASGDAANKDYVDSHSGGSLTMQAISSDTTTLAGSGDWMYMNDTNMLRFTVDGTYELHATIEFVANAGVFSLKAAGFFASSGQDDTSIPSPLSGVATVNSVQPTNFQYLSFATTNETVSVPTTVITISGASVENFISVWVVPKISATFPASTTAKTYFWARKIY